MIKNPKFLKGVFATLAIVVLGTPLFAEAYTLTRQLEVGSTGTDVSALQTFLALDSSLYPEGLVTGYFGALTQGAVRRFQTRNNISAVGRIGPATLPVINAQMNSGSTVGSDRTTPFIYSVIVSTSNTEATINWTTSKNTAAIIYYSTSSIALTEGDVNGSVHVSGTSFLVHSDLRTTHQASLTNLQPSTTYNYVVYVRDASGNERVTWPETFRTK